MTMNPSPNAAKTDERASWLELARRQSRKLAETRAQHVPALRLQRETATDQGNRGKRRLSWAAALLPILILGGATGTWAFVAHLRARTESRRPVVVDPSVKPEGATPRPAGHNQIEQPRLEPAPAPEPRPRKPAARRPKPKVRRARPQVEEPAVTTEAPLLRDNKPQQVIFGSSSEPVIIVNPPARLGPLWTPEDYKRRGPRGAVGH